MMKYLQNIILILVLLLMTNAASAQRDNVLRGTISDSDTKERIIGATIAEYDKDDRIIGGSITDINGNFVLNIRSADNVFRASCIGFEALEFSIQGKTVVQLELKSESIQMEEVVVIAAIGDRDALSGVAERDATGSRVKVDMINTKHVGISSAEEALQGTISGVDIMASSGNPGSGSVIVIRGLSSLGGARPLIVVDNVPQDIRIDQNFDFASADQEDIGDLVNISPQDIKSIEVLKDASSAAVWGSKGANGVLLIETHRGRKGKTVFEYQGKYTLNVQPSAIPMQNGDEYITLQLEELQNAYGLFLLPQEIAYDRTFADFYNYSANTDWLDAITQYGFINDQYFKLSGGGEKTSYFISTNYLKNSGTTINTSLSRFSTRINLDYNVSTKIHFSININYTNSYKEDNYFDRNDMKNRQIREMAYIKAPNMSIWEYDQYGNPTGEYFTPILNYQGDGLSYYNPVAIGNLSVNDNEENQLENNFTLRYQMLPWLRMQEMIVFQYLGNKGKQFLPLDAVGADWINTLNNKAKEENTSSDRILSRSQLFFLPRLKNKKHSLNGILTAEVESSTLKGMYESGGIGPSVNLSDAALQTPILSLSSTRVEQAGLGFLGSMNYKYKDRYLVSVNTRLDGSSKFGASQRWGLFPSISTGWRFSSEEWFNSMEWLSNGKIRASWGQVGKQPNSAYDRHAIFDPAIPNRYINNPIIIPKQVQLDNLKWETVTAWNIGIDLGAMKERYTLTVEWYNKETKDILWQNYEIPLSSGFNTLKSFNGGVVENYGWEIYGRADVIRKSELKLNFNFNLAQNFNSFLEFPANFNNEINTSISTGQYPVKANVGQPIGSFYGFNYLGVWPSDEAVIATNANGEILLDILGNPVPLSYKGTYEFRGGDARYEDVNHDGQIDLNDVVYLGDSNPSIIGGFGSSLSWKQFDLSAQFQFRTGFQIVNMMALSTEGMQDKNNQSKAVLHRWTYQGQDEPDMLPRAYLNHPANNLGSNRYVEDGDFLRLNYVTVSYALKREICRRLKLKSFDMALNMRKLFTITNYTGQDPEIPQIADNPFWIGADRARTPPPKAFTFSVAVGF